MMTKNTISAGSTGGGQCPAHNPHTRSGQYFTVNFSIFGTQIFWQKL